MHHTAKHASPLAHTLMSSIYLFVPPVLIPVIYSVKTKPIQQGIVTLFSCKREWLSHSKQGGTLNQSINSDVVSFVSRAPHQDFWERIGVRNSKHYLGLEFGSQELPRCLAISHVINIDVSLYVPTHMPSLTVMIKLRSWMLFSCFSQGLYQTVWQIGSYQ